MNIEQNAKNIFIDKNSVKTTIQEFIDNSRYNIESRTNNINSILQTMREENEQLISKCKKFFFYNF